MPETNVKKIEQGKATFAYDCAKQNLTMKNFDYESQTIDFNKLFKDAFEKKFEKKLKDNQTNKDLLADFLKNTIQKAKDWQKEEKNFKADILTYYYKYGKEYKSYARKIPMLIKTNGLGATYAFVKSKGKDGNAYDLLYNQTAKWLEVSKCPFIKVSDDLVRDIIGLNSNAYRSVTNEIISLFTWLRRFAEGLIEGEDEQDL